MTRFDVRESLAMTGRGPWVVGELRDGPLVVGDVLVVAHSGTRVRVRAVEDDGSRLLLDERVPAGAVLVGVGDPVPGVAVPTGVPAGPVHYEVQFAGTVTGRGPVLAGLLRRGVIEPGEALAVVGTGAPVRVRQVELHRRETVEGTVVGMTIEPDDAPHVREGDVLVSPEGVR